MTKWSFLLVLGHRQLLQGGMKLLGVSKETCELNSLLITNLRSHRAFKVTTARNMNEDKPSHLENKYGELY